VTKSERLYRRRDDGGMTLIEMVVTLALTSIVMAMSTLLVIRITTETNAQRQTIQGVEQAQLAEKTFTQYLRSAFKIINVTNKDLVFSTLSGTADSSSTGGQPQPYLEVIEAEICPTKNSAADSLEVIYDLPSGSTGLHECIAPTSPSTTNVAVPTNAYLAESFSVEPPNATIGALFDYYSFTSNEFTQICTTASPCTTAAEVATIAAIGVNLTFLPLVGHGNDFDMESATTVQTMVYLKNVACAGSSACIS
jgi:prepilin-type N-terminal cleavage/methylation domain-containing protein